MGRVRGESERAMEMKRTEGGVEWGGSKKTRRGQERDAGERRRERRGLEGYENEEISERCCICKHAVLNDS